MVANRSRAWGIIFVLMAATAGAILCGAAWAAEPAARRPATAQDSQDPPAKRAAEAALNWLARHQTPTGCWSLGEFDRLCKSGKCSGAGSATSDPAATGLAVLAFLGSGHTHEARGPYQRTVYNGLGWLLANQQKDGALGGKEGGPRMYAHGMAALALAEAYAATKDKRLGTAAQQAIRFIEKAQHPKTGGWRYVPGQEGDTSIFGWQFAALQTGTRGGLEVKRETLERAQQWLKSVAQGEHGGRFSYTPGGGGTPAMTAVGLRCRLFQPVRAEDPAMAEGLAVLREASPAKARNAYYWYYAAQVMELAGGPEQQTWTQDLVKALCQSQITEGCARGSWDPDQPTKDMWGPVSGRVALTCLYTLALEAPQRRLQVFRPAAEPKP